MPRQIFPQWREQIDATRYPFAIASSLTNGTKIILEGTLIDAALYPQGAGSNLRLSQVDVTHDTVTLWIGDETEDQLASGSFSLTSPPDSVALQDAVGRPAGILVSESVRLGLFGTWGVGSYTFTAAQTEFAATVCFPQPAIGVRGVLLDDGTLLTGPVWLIGGPGVVLRSDTIQSPVAGQPCLASESQNVIRVDIVGDPLYRRQLCVPAELFVTKRFLKTITFRDSQQAVIVGPDSNGNVTVTVNNDLTADTILRVHPDGTGTTFEAVGSMLKDVVPQ